MGTKNFSRIYISILMLVVASLACGQFGAVPTETPTAAPTATATATVKPTATKKPTSTPKPTATPNIEATKKAEAFNALLKDYEEKGYITTTQGETTKLESYKNEWAQLGWYQWKPVAEDVENFVFSGHFHWSTAGTTPETSGCGVLFGLQDNQDHYAVFIDKSRILFLMNRGPNVYGVGKTRGPGRLNLTNPADADVVVIVKGQTSYVSVNGEVTEYTLSVDQETRGGLAFSLLSGTNKDYGTRCEMSEMVLWQPE